MGTGDYICVTVRGGAPWGFSLCEGEGDAYRPLQVYQVEEGGRASLAGICEGDEVLSLNGEPSGDLSLPEAMALIDACVNCLQLLVKRSQPHRELYIAKSQDVAYYGEMESDTEAPRGTHLVRTQLCVPAPGQCIGPESQLLRGGGDGGRAGPQGGSFSPRAMVELQLSLAEHTLEDPVCTSLGSALGIEGEIQAREALQNKALLHTTTHSLYVCGPAREPLSQHGVVEITLQHPAVGRGSLRLVEGVGACGARGIVGGALGEERAGQSQGDPASFIVSFGIPEEGAEPAEEPNSDSEKDLGIPNKHRARHARLRRSESLSDKQVKEAKSKCKRIAILLNADAPNPNNKGVLMFKRHRQRAKKYTLVSYGTGESEPEYEGDNSEEEEDYDEKDTRKIKFPLVATTSESELDEDFITNAQGGGRVITCDWDTGLLEIKRKLNSGEEMEQLPNTTGKGATMFAQRRHRMDEIAAEHEEMRRQGIPVEGVQEVEKHAAYQQMEERSYMQATTESQAYMDVNVHQKQQQQYQQYQEQQYYEQQQQYQQQQYNQQQQYQQQQQQYQQQQYQQQQQHHQQQEYQQQQQIQQYSYNMNGVANHHTNEMQSSMSNRTPQPFSVQNQVPAPFSSPVSGSIQEAMGKGEQIASRDERISTPAIKSGILQDTRNRFKGKPMFNFKQAPKVPPNPELMNLLNRSDKKLDFESGTEEDYLSLGAEACNFLQSPRVKHKTPPPVAPKPIINPNSPPWSPQPELSNQELPLHAENSVPAPAAASEPESAPAPELEPTPALAPEPSPPIASQEVPTNPPSLEKHTWSPPGSQAEQQPQQVPAWGGNGPSPPQPHSQCEPQVSSKAPPQTQAQQQPPQQPPMSTWAPAEMKSQAPAPSQSPQQLPWVTPQPQAQPPMNYWAPAPAQSQPQWAQPQEQAQDQPPWVQPQEQVQQQPQPPWAQPQEQVQQQPQPPWTQPQEQVQQHPQPPWAQPQEQVQQQPQPPWTQPQEQAQAQPPRVQPQEQVQQQPQPPWAQPQEQVQQQPQPPWTQPQEQAQAQPPQAQLHEQVQQQPQPPWAQPQEQVQQQSRPPWAQPQEQVQQQSRPPWAQPQEQVQQQPQPPWTQPQEQVQQQPQPPWAQPQEQVQQQPQPPWCQQHQPPQQAWPEAQTQAQPRPPWVSSPQPPMNAWTPPQSQAQPPQPPWAQPAQPPAQPQPPMNAWAQAPAQAQVQLPWAQQAQLPINAWTPDQNQAQPQSPWAQTTPTQSPPQQSWQLQPPQHAPSQPPMNAWAPAQAQPQTHTSMWAPQPQQAPVNTQTPMDRVAQPSPKPGNALQKAPHSTPPPRPQRINSYTLGERSSSPLINPMASVLIPVQGMGSALSMPAVTGKGADLFAKRQSRMEKYVVDSDTVLAATARENKARPTSPSPSVPHSWKYSPNCRAPPTSNYNPIQSPSYPPGAIKQPPPSSPAAKAKKGKGKPACKPLAVIDVMKHQPYQLNASLFTYGPAVEAAEAAKAAAPKPAPVPPNQNQPIRYEQLSPVQPAGPMNASYPQQAQHPQQPNGMPPQPHMHDGPYHQVSPNAYQPPNNPYQQAPAGPYPQPYNPLYQQAPTAPYQPQPQAPNPSYQPTPQGPYQSAHSPPYQAAPQAPYQPLPPSTYVVPSFPIAAKPESISGGSTAPKPRFMAKKSSAQVWKPVAAEKE